MATDSHPAAVIEQKDVPASCSCHDRLVLRCAGYENSVRWREGERLEQLFEQRCDEHRDRVAVDGPGGRLSYGELDARANELARFLSARGAVQPGDRVGLLFDDPVDGYRGMLAVLKLHAAYVPLDPGFPRDRLSYITSDAELKTVLTRSHLADALSGLENDPTVIHLDESDEAIAEQSPERLQLGDISGADDGQLAYVIYTSGTTGRPKGVAIAHHSICNFVRVAAEVYGISYDDRVYQGLTIAFDFAVEEIWVPWIAGATLVPKPAGANLLGPELAAFLKEHAVTALCCVPTLLATLDEDLPDLRFLLVSGEACPQDLARRWYREGRRFLNVYGPTEATVTATWTVLGPDRTVTIGVPLPTYSIVILDPENDEALPLEKEGEIGIAGIGLGEGYLGNAQKTRESFIPDFLELRDNPSGRIYRTGDLGAVNDAGELEHRGRIDTQVKIRGYRIELEEIEAILREEPGVRQAVVATHQPEPEVDELAAFYQPDAGPDDVDEDRVYEDLQQQLPPYMVPSYLEEIEDVPVQPSGKVDRKQLPEPTGERHVAVQGEHVEAESELERTLARKLGKVLGLDSVSVESHFFEELGASSLLMARFSAELRQADGDLPAVSMQDLYQHPTIRSLAEVLAGGGGATSGVPQFDEPEQPAPIGAPHYVLCGALQVLTFLAYAAVAAVAFGAATNWLVAGHDVIVGYLRALAIGAALVAGMGGVPIVAKWMLIGRFKPQRIRVWSLPYVRFWVVKTLIAANPAMLLFRSPGLYRLYLRALGARIGPGAVILTRHVPVCTDLVSIGANSLIRKDTYLNGYRARDGAVEIGPVSIGEDAFLGERTVLDVYSTVETGAAVGHSSSVQAGQVVPAGETWNGSPAQPAGPEYDYRTVAPLAQTYGRQLVYNALLLSLALLVVTPAEAAAVSFLVAHPGFLTDLPVQDAFLIAAGATLGALAAVLLIAGLIPRLLSRLLEPERVYPLFGLHYALHRIILGTSNNPFLTRLFGDSVAIDGYLRYLGWKFAELVPSGSNFGIDVRQELPALTRIGAGTMVSDGLSVMNAEYSATSFRVLPADIGEACFLGNSLAWPAGSKIGDNLLVATKAMLPLDGEVRSDTGLLGSPCFEIPRAVEGDEEFERLQQEPEKSRRLRAKTRHNVVTMGLYLFTRFLVVALILVLDFAPAAGWAGSAGSEVLELLLVPLLVFPAAELAAGGRRLQPQQVPILDGRFWAHERFWKLQSDRYLRLFDGTPFKGLLWRLLGVKVGRRLFDDGCIIIERSLTSLGDDVTLNMGAFIQPHSLENGVFKSGCVSVGSRCTVGVASLVHYGTTMGDAGVLEADAFLMKGSDVPEHARWRGNPANEVSQ